MEKQLACAAATSSSGLVEPPGSSVFAFEDTERSLNALDVVALTTPLPARRSPFQTACADRVAATGSPCVVGWVIGPTAQGKYRSRCEGGRASTISTKLARCFGVSEQAVLAAAEGKRGFEDTCVTLMSFNRKRAPRLAHASKFNFSMVPPAGLEPTT